MKSRCNRVCSDFTWILQRFYSDFTCGFTAPQKFCRKILHGFHVDFTWILYAILQPLKKRARPKFFENFTGILQRILQWILQRILQWILQWILQSRFHGEIPSGGLQFRDADVEFERMGTICP